MIIKKAIRKFRFSAKLLETYFFQKHTLTEAGWFESRFQFRAIDASKKPIPWLPYAFIHFLQPRLDRNMKVFEHGSGNSTIWFSNYVKEVIALEHDKEYYDFINPAITLQRNTQHEFQSLENGYSSNILNYSKQFHIITVDGRDRIQCAKNSVAALREDGVIIFDNTDRAKYSEIYPFLAKLGFKNIEFKGIGPISFQPNQTTLFYRTNNCLGI